MYKVTLKSRGSLRALEILKKKSPVKASKNFQFLASEGVGQRAVNHQRGKVGSIPFSSPLACEEALLQPVLCHMGLPVALVT